jgi:hypothetical protein
MNNKEKLKNILLLSTFILSDEEYGELNRLLENNKLNRARLLLDDLLESKEVEMIMEPDNQEYIIEYKQLDNLQNLIIDLIVNEKVDEREKQFESNLKQQ